MPDMHHYLFTTAVQQMFSSHLAIVGIDRDNANVGIRGCQWSLVTIIVVTSGTHHQPLNTLPLFTDNPTMALHSPRKLLRWFIFPRPSGQMMRLA